MEVSPTQSRFCGGKSTPAIRAIRAPYPFAPAIPGAACVSDCCKSPEPRRAGESPCTCRKSFSPKTELSCLPLSRAREAAARGLLVPVNDPAARQIVRRKLDGHLVPGQDADEILAHLSGNVREHLMLVFQLHAEHGIRQRLNHRGHHLDGILFGIARVRFLLVVCWPLRHTLQIPPTRMGRRFLLA